MKKKNFPSSPAKPVKQVSPQLLRPNQELRPSNAFPPANTSPLSPSTSLVLPKPTAGAKVPLALPFPRFPKRKMQISATNSMPIAPTSQKSDPSGKALPSSTTTWPRSLGTSQVKSQTRSSKAAKEKILQEKIANIRRRAKIENDKKLQQLREEGAVGAKEKARQEELAEIKRKAKIYIEKRI